ncbi:MAG: DUF6398 domain-containing protein [Sulfobacillus sp.]
MADKRRVQDLQRQLIQLTAAFCQAHIDAEYEALCQKLIDKMARKRAVPFLSGRLEIWTAAVVYAIGSINFLFDKTFQPYASTDSLCDYFKVSKSTVGQKAKRLREMFKMGYYDPEFSTEHMRENNPFARLALVDGFLVIQDP